MEKGNVPVYRSFNELLKANIVDMYEYRGYYYVRVKPTSMYDESVWKVNKTTKKVTCIHFVETFTIPIEDRIQIDPKKMRN